MTLPTTAENSLITLADDTLEKSVFLCRACWSLFENEQKQDAFDCPNCSTPEKPVKLYAEPAAAWMRARITNAKRPMSPETRAKIAEAQRRPHVRGAQSPEAKARVGGHHFKHGLSAKVRVLPRAAHGRLAACKTCPFASPAVNSAGDGRCLNDKWTDCAFQGIELFAFSQAIAHKNLDDIKAIVGDIQAKEAFVLNMALNEVIRDGITVEETTERSFGDKGSTIETKVKLNPALEAVSIVSRALGGIGLQDFLLTPKSGNEDQVKRNLADDLRNLIGHFDSPDLPATDPDPLQLDEPAEELPN